MPKFDTMFLSFFSSKVIVNKIFSAEIRMPRNISNLIIVLVISISFRKCDFYQEPVEENSSPETTHFEVTGLNDEQINQIAETLGFFAKTISESTEKRKKKNAMKKSRFGQKGARLGQKSARLWGRVGLQLPQDTVC